MAGLQHRNGRYRILFRYEQSPAGNSLGNTLEVLRDRYLAVHADSLEKNTLYTARIHFAHLLATLGDKKLLRELVQDDLQRHVQRRSGMGIASVTIKKEIHGFRAAWNWGKRAGLVTKEWPGKGLVYPKTKEKPPFQTREEIERRIARGGLSEEDKAALWNSLYLTAEELKRFLDHVRQAARHPFIYPMICMAAHTGARRSELIRAEISDVDFAADQIQLREKKRVKGQVTFRRVPLTPHLRSVLESWLAQHPGGVSLFCHEAEVARSRKRSLRTGFMNQKTRPTAGIERQQNIRLRERPGFAPLTESEAADHFQRTVQNSEWQVVPGWHALRHTFASILATNTDQKLINAWMGHQTLEQQKRYQHLFPKMQHEAIRKAFD
jgi:integrase